MDGQSLGRWVARRGRCRSLRRRGRSRCRRCCGRCSPRRLFRDHHSRRPEQGRTDARREIGEGDRTRAPAVSYGRKQSGGGIITIPPPFCMSLWSAPSAAEAQLARSSRRLRKSSGLPISFSASGTSGSLANWAIFPRTGRYWLDTSSGGATMRKKLFTD